jgi:hypothetical protein
LHPYEIVAMRVDYPEKEKASSAGN